MDVTTEVASVADAGNEDNDFRRWMKAMGFNAKQVSYAGDQVGMSPSLAGHSSRGLRELSYTERMAMAAATVGLPEWNPETAGEIEAMRTLHQVLRTELAQAKSGAAPEEDAVRTIRAIIRSEAHRLATEGRPARTEDPETDRAILDLLRAAVQGTSGR